MWVNEVSCESSQPCFTSCFTHHKWTHDCNHTQDIAIQCGEETIEFNCYSMSCLISISLAFDVNRAHEMTSGSRAQCNIKCKLLVSESCTIFNLSDSIGYNFCPAISIYCSISLGYTYCMYHPGSAGSPGGGIWCGYVHCRNSLLQKEMYAKESSL